MLTIDLASKRSTRCSPSGQERIEALCKVKAWSSVAKQVDEMYDWVLTAESRRVNDAESTQDGQEDKIRGLIREII